MASILSIGTTHPWNIAGVGLDLTVGAELGATVLTVVAAVSAQDAAGVRDLHPVPHATFAAQLACVPWREVAAIRVGALPNAAAVATVAEALVASGAPAVVDPVVAATRGGALGDDAVLPALRERLAGLPNVILTPNLDEAARLLGRETIARDDLADAAAKLRARGARAVLLKGGHLDGAPCDALATVDGVTTFADDRLAHGMRGTGCVLAAALACALGRGDALSDAVAFARAFVREKIAHARERGGLRVAY
ncbi:MAG: bifunctional hydroxymethylpyrimidine kinase/phosphomethylpyrimidine kinase [bacterium]|nr:bifunctional hydroxymethylpyrimidine kinase/phosphomethylpyrimidine kinase [bacterium]